MSICWKQFAENGDEKQDLFLFASLAFFSPIVLFFGTNQSREGIRTVASRWPGMCDTRTTALVAVAVALVTGAERDWEQLSLRNRTGDDTGVEPLRDLIVGLAMACGVPVCWCLAWSCRWERSPRLKDLISLCWRLLADISASNYG